MKQKTKGNQNSNATNSFKGTPQIGLFIGYRKEDNETENSVPSEEWCAESTVAYQQHQTRQMMNFSIFLLHKN